jgi:hypothetical protein
MYQQYIDRITNQPYPQGIKRLADNAFIPFDPDNTDYQQYLRWLEAGNTPLPADEPETN